MFEKPETRLVTDTEADRIRSLPPLSSYLPITFLNNASVNGLSVNCSGCGCELSSDSIQAEVDNNGCKAVIRAYGMCLPCKILTPVEVRLRDDGTMLLKAGSSWSEGRYAAERQVGIIAQIKLLLSKLLIK